MEKKQHRFIIKGMNRDLSISKTNNEYSYENHNLRIDVNQDNNLLTLTSESSTERVINIEGVILGHAVIEDSAIIFAKGEEDFIYKFYNNNLEVLVSGNLNFSIENPIETIPLVETSNVKKVYWIDGINVPRVINIHNFKPIISSDNNLITMFDFTADLKLEEEVVITKVHNGLGSFPSGTIQYVFTYYNTFGKESSIFYYSPLNYLTHHNRGASPEEKTTQSFNITINNIQEGWEYIRVYSIVYTSLEATPIVNRVRDVEIKSSNSITIQDTNREVESVDNTLLYFIGADSLVPYTFTQKDNTLFLGNYKNTRKHIIEYTPKTIPVAVTPKIVNRKRVNNVILEESSKFYYDYNLHKDEAHIKHFKSGERYNLGVVFQHKNGKLSSPVFLTEYTVPNQELSITDGVFTPNMLQLEIPLDLINELPEGYIKAIPVVGYPTKRRVVCQGVLNPTVYNVGDRYDNSPYAQSSWFFRPNPPTENPAKYGNIQYRHNKAIEPSTSVNGEIINLMYDDNFSINYNSETSWKPRRNRFAIDRSLVSLYSPECLLDDLQLNSKYSLNIVGLIPIHASYRKYNITTAKAPKVIEDRVSNGFIDIDYFQENSIKNYSAYATLSAHPAWEEHLDVKRGRFYNTRLVVYPFHNTGGIGYYKQGDEATSTLKTKNLYNYRYSRNNIYKDIKTLTVEDAIFIDSLDNKLYQIKKDSKNVFYKNNIDKVVYGGGIDKLGKFNPNYHTPQAKFDGLDWSIETNEDFKHTNPINITYKNNKHILISTDVLPYIEYLKDSTKKDGSKLILLDQYFVDEDNKKVTYIFLRDSFNINTLLDRDEVIAGYKTSIQEAFTTNNVDSTLDSLTTSYDGRFTVYNVTLNYTDEDFKDRANLNNVGSIIEDVLNDKEGVKKIDIDNIFNPVITEGFREVGWEYTGGTLIFVRRQFLHWFTVQFKNTPKKYIEDKIVPFLQNEFSKILPYHEITSIEEEGEDTTMKFSLNVYRSGTSLKFEVIPYKDELIGILHKFRDEDIITEDNSIVHSVSLLKYPDLIKEYGFLLLGELIDNNKYDTRIEDIKWTLGGEGTILKDNILINYTIGDTYYQRFNCVGTLPRAKEDENQVTDILSFMVETTVNMNSVYDKNRSNYNFTSVNTDNYNKLNPVYQQSNNYFKFPYMNPRLFNDDYPATITWTLPKHLGEEVDSWMNITGISKLDLEGDKGAVTKLITFNNNILSFQSNGLANILYNNRVQIPVSDGIPIEIANGTKVEGFRYISDIIGCQNKWSVCRYNGGVMFIDDNSDILYNLSDGLKPISEQTGFRTYMMGRLNKDVYTPINQGTITFYDEYRGDVYIVNDRCLSYSTKLGGFETFLDYERTKAMFNINSDTYSIAEGSIWRHRANTCNNLHGEVKPFHIIYRVNPDGLNDKTFTNVETRADSYHLDTLLPKLEIASIEASTEYQVGKTNLKYQALNRSPIKKKYRVWRMDVPRQNKTMNRIRNPWCNIKLTSTLSTNKTNIHDVVITYYE